MKHRKKGMNHRVEVFVTDCREYDEIHSTIFTAAGDRIVLSTIDCHLVSTCSQPGTQLLGKGLEASIVGWNTSRPQDRYFHIKNLELLLITVLIPRSTLGR